MKDQTKINKTKLSSHPTEGLDFKEWNLLIEDKTKGAPQAQIEELFSMTIMALGCEKGNNFENIFTMPVFKQYPQAALNSIGDCIGFLTTTERFNHDAKIKMIDVMLDVSVKDLLPSIKNGENQNLLGKIFEKGMYWFGKTNTEGAEIETVSHIIRKKEELFGEKHDFAAMLAECGHMKDQKKINFICEGIRKNGQQHEHEKIREALMAACNTAYVYSAEPTSKDALKTFLSNKDIFTDEVLDTVKLGLKGKIGEKTLETALKEMQPATQKLMP